MRVTKQKGAHRKRDLKKPLQERVKEAWIERNKATYCRMLESQLTRLMSFTCEVRISYIFKPEDHIMKMMPPPSMIFDQVGSPIVFMHPTSALRLINVLQEGENRAKFGL